MSALNENHVEEAAIAYLQELGYAYKPGPEIAPDTPTSERLSYGDVLLLQRLKDAIARLNPTIPSDAREDALRCLQQAGYPGLIEENQRLHQFLIEGVPVQFYSDDGSLKGELVRLIDFEDVEANDWLAVNQFTVIENKTNRRPDVVIFINGLPLAVIELKNPGDENATLEGAYNQLQTYKAQIPSIFRTNAALVISDGMYARIGSLTADRERFMPWRTIDGRAYAPKGTPELETSLKGIFERRRFLDLLRDFIVFGQIEAKDGQSQTVKILAGYHQFHAVREAVQSTVAATRPDGDRRIGVIWHTQGSGKSLLMAFYAGQIIKHPALANPTLVVLTDRNDLDDQLLGTFSICKALLRQTPVQADSRAKLRELLDRPSGGVIFTTIQKFSPEEGERDFPLLTEDRTQVGIPEGEAVAVMLEKYEIVREMFQPDTPTGFDYRPALEAAATATQRLATMAGAMDWILGLQQRDAARETTEEGKKRALRRFDDAVVNLGKAYALAAASEAAQEIRDEVGFFQAIRVALSKDTPDRGMSLADRELAIRQILSRAVVSTEIVDIMAAAGLETPDISILSDEFLAEVQNLDKKNLALEALRKLINGEVRAQARVNATLSKAFSERLEEAIARYHSNAITTVQVLEELIKLAKDIKAARQRGEETGLNEQEIAFYDALAENQSARELMGEPKLKVIAFELLNSLKSNITVDWMHRDAARARLRVLVKKILRKYGYPPDLQDSAVQTVLRQAELLSADWARAAC